eukprot:Hpha_TRINITY_DN16099_c2_g14::TRINITY_DN16099_c2_g14_i1::g.119009::m.119009/K05864/PPID, CYPD; peptidyl-prolyl isomerase D
MGRAESGSETRRRCFLDISIAENAVGRIVVELFYDAAPRTCENFRALCTGERGHVPDHPEVAMCYAGSVFHRVIAGFMIQGGDFTAGDGTGGWSIWGDSFADEGFTHAHDSAGLLSMANSGPDTNCSQFFITTATSTHLDQRHVVFGKVVKGMSVVRRIENVGVGRFDRPEVEVKITASGDLANDEEDGVVADAQDPFEDFPQDCDPPLEDDRKVEVGEMVRGLGNERFKQGDYGGAIEKYEKALRYLSSARPEQEKVAGVVKQKVACLSNTAQCHLKLHQWARARSAGEEALKHDPCNPKVLFRIATALFELKDDDGARQYANRAKEESPDDKGPPQLLAKIKQRKQAQGASMRKMFD